MEQSRIYACHTLVDITPTGVIRDLPGQELQRNQQRNWETVLQCIGLITQPNVLRAPSIVDISNIENLSFGEFYKGPQKVWTFTFGVDREDVFRRGNDEFANLEDSFDQVPVVTYLTETARFMLPIFYTQGAIKNIYFNNIESALNK
jgi:hypothetical protein